MKTSQTEKNGTQNRTQAKKHLVFMQQRSYVSFWIVRGFVCGHRNLILARR